MKKTAVVYWSSTGNTEEMAKAVAEGAKAAGAEVDVLTFGETTVEAVLAYDAIALGCPAMGDEGLEDGEVEPFFSEMEGKLSGRSLALFGSYDWGDGEWMRQWCKRAEDAGAHLVQEEGLICNNTPEEEGLEECRSLGKKLAE